MSSKITSGSQMLASLAVLAACALGCGKNAEDGEDGGMSMVSGPEEHAGANGGSAGSSPSAGDGSPGSGGNRSQAGSGAAGDAPAAGGAADAGEDPPFMPLAIAELPDEFAVAICDAMEACVGASALRELTAREACAPRVAAELRATEFHYMTMAIDSGHVLYDPSRLAACLDGVRELGCEVLTDSFPQPCVEVLAGNVALGGACSISAECEGTAFCAGAASATCPSTCTELLPEGATCSADNECADDLLCLAGRCELLSRSGEACNGTSGKMCALGLNCLGASDTAIGQCVENAEVQVGEQDESCEPGGTLCREGLSCVFDGSAGFHCQPYVAAGEACHLGLPGQCPAGEYCDAASVTEEGTCRPLPGDGDACVLSGLCAGGLACVDDGVAVCRAIQSNGSECSTDRECRSGHCESGRCEAPAVCP